MSIPEPDYRGKVRDVYDLGDKMLMVASDRFSAFDVVFPEIITDKGRILTEISAHWFSLLQIPSHFISSDINDFPEPFLSHPEIFSGRSMLVKRALRIDYECVVRATLMGSGYKEYRESGTLAGVKMPEGLVQGELLREPVFTPAVKNDEGHDENISFQEMESREGKDLAVRLRDKSLQIFNFASEKLAEQGIVLLDTKFEFGWIDGELVLIDEVLTPDSSRFSLKEEYDLALSRGEVPPSMDKQVVRDFLERSDWNKSPPPPELPQEIIDSLLDRYNQIKEKILCII